MEEKVLPLPLHSPTAEIAAQQAAFKEAEDRIAEGPVSPLPIHSALNDYEVCDSPFDLFVVLHTAAFPTMDRI